MEIKTIYASIDGVEFDTERECIEHEKLITRGAFLSYLNPNEGIVEKLVDVKSWDGKMYEITTEDFEFGWEENMEYMRLDRVETCVGDAINFYAILSKDGYKTQELLSALKETVSEQRKWLDEIDRMIYNYEGGRNGK